jgi:hypothetical protein
MRVCVRPCMHACVFAHACLHCVCAHTQMPQQQQMLQMLLQQQQQQRARSAAGTPQPPARGGGGGGGDGFSLHDCASAAEFVPRSVSLQASDSSGDFVPYSLPTSAGGGDRLVPAVVTNSVGSAKGA